MTQQTAAALLLLTSCASAAESNWPEFRGPGGTGIATGPAPVRWSESENVLWKTEIPGRGWSSPVVQGDRVWLTTAIEEAASPDEAKAKAQGGNPDPSLARRIELRAVCVDRRTGGLIANHLLFEVDSPDTIHALNSYASPTPVLAGDRLYCWFGCYGTCALDTESVEVLWRSREDIEHYVGPGSSPVLWNELLVLTCDGADKQYVTALRTADGSRAWKTDRPGLKATDPDFKKAYATPAVVGVRGEEQVVVPGAEWLVAYNPATGEELWRVNHGGGFSVVPRPVERDGVLYYSSGFADDQMIAVRTDGRGDVTDTHVLWRAKRQTPHMPSPLMVGDTVVTVSDQGIAVGLNAATGTEVWKKRVGGGHCASPVLADGKIYFFGQDGRTTVLDPAVPEREPVAVNQLDGRIMATPAFLPGLVILRTEKALYAIGR